MTHYSVYPRMLVAIDCIIFGFDHEGLKVLLIKRGFHPEKDNWSLMGGFLQLDETLDQAANRVLKQLTGLEGVYMEQLQVFSHPDRDPEERTISVAYSALVDIGKYQLQISDDYHAEWFLLKNKPGLIFDHDEMVRTAQKNLRYKASIHPILFELLPEKFTLPQIQGLYEGVYDASFDNRNFSKKLLSTGLVVRQSIKDKSASRKGAYYYKLDKKKYRTKQDAFLSLVPKTEKADPY